MNYVLLVAVVEYRIYSMGNVNFLLDHKLTDDDGGSSLFSKRYQVTGGRDNRNWVIPISISIHPTRGNLHFIDSNFLDGEFVFLMQNVED